MINIALLVAAVTRHTHEEKQRHIKTAKTARIGKLGKRSLRKDR